MTTGMATDEIRNNLLVQAFFSIYPVKDTLELIKQTEGRFTHECQDTITCMFWSHFETAAYMSGNQFSCILLGNMITMLVFTFV